MTKTGNESEYRIDFTDIHDCLANAYCYSIMTQQWGFCRAFESSVGELNNLADSLIESGLLPQDSNGNLGSPIYQKLIDEGAEKTKDPRFIRFSEITKLRFLVKWETDLLRNVN